MNNNKQKLLIEYLISSPDTFASCQGIINAEYFDPEYRNAVNFIKNYYENYNTLPSTGQIKAESGVVFEKTDVPLDKINWCCDEIEKFCKNRAMERAILKAVPLVNAGNPEAVEALVKEALLVSLNRDLGLRYYDDPQKRLEHMLESGEILPTGWSEVDELLYGGIGRKELLLVSANSGGGKSICLANLALNFSERGYNVLYASLELSEDIIAQRFDTMITGISRKEWKNHINEISTRIQEYGTKKGVIDIKQFPVGTSAVQFNAYLKEYYLTYGFMPDLFVCDYVDLMHPNEKNVDLSDLWTKDKLCSEQLRDIGVRNNIFVATASQLNRSAVNATHQSHDQIAGGISKINTADVYWSIVMNATQKAKGELMFHFQKTRNSDGVGKTVYLTWDAKFLRIRDRNNTPDPSPLNFKKKERGQNIKADILGDTPSGDGLLDLLSSTRVDH
jgi:hypothetical protein